MKLFTTIKYNYLIIKDRVKKESPAFFQKAKILSIKVTTAAVAVIALNASGTVILPVDVITVLSYAIALCVGVFGTSVLTKKD